MKKFSLVMILVGCILVGCSDKPNDIKEQQPEVETEQQVTSEEETPEEEQDTEDEENNTEEKPQETNDSDELSPDETENHYDELEADKRFNDIQILAKALAEASGRSYDDTWNDVYNCAITYGFEYAQNYANSKIEAAKAKQQAGGGQGPSTSKEELLKHIDDWDYACLAYEYIPSGNVGGGSYAAEASKYSSYMEYYFSVPQKTRDQLKSLFKGQCPSITGEDWFKFQSEINGCGQQLREAIRSGM